MKIISNDEFIDLSANGWEVHMNTTPYINHTFECACGKEHKFNQYIRIIRELPKQRLIFVCPDDISYVTCVKVKGWFRFKGFESLYGTYRETEEEKQERLEKEALLKGTL